MVVSVCLLSLSQEGELIEEPLLFFLWQTVEKLLWTLLLGLSLRSCLLRLELLLLRLLELLLLWPKRLPCLLLRLKLLLRVKLSLKLLLLLRSELLLWVELLLLLLSLEALILRLEPLLRPRLVRLETGTVVGLCTEWLETLLSELPLLEQSQLLTRSEDNLTLLAFKVADKDTTLLS